MEIIKPKSVITKIMIKKKKNTLQDRFNSRIEMTEDRICELENRPIEIIQEFTQSEQQE